MNYSHALLFLTVLSSAATAGAADPAIDIGSRRQLFVDSHLIEKMEGTRQVLHHPVRREVAIKIEHPWEKGGVSYTVTFKDGDKFRAWYRAEPERSGRKGRPPSFPCMRCITGGCHRITFAG